MFSRHNYVFLCVIIYIITSQPCLTEPVLPPMLFLYSPGDPEYTDVLVKRVHDDLTLACELRGDNTPRGYVWNYVGDNGTMGQRPFTTEPVGLTISSKLIKRDLQVSDSGQYLCSAPPFSVTKYVLVQTRGPKHCAKNAFWCGLRCVLLTNVCDGRADCLHGEDESATMCSHNVCSRPDKLNCSSGRCISARACCRGAAPLCQQPACCDEFTPRADLEGYVDVEYPPLFEDRHAPDDYGFIQSTIYTVTACALIFMIAVVLLVSAICKMQMKRAALRGYTHADRATRHHYSVHYAQAHRFPPCYEASRLLEQDGRTAAVSPPQSPQRPPPNTEPSCGLESPTATDPPRGLARLSSIFSSRYRQVPTQPSDVEMTNVCSTSLTNSPSRAPPLSNYRSPTYCDLNTEFLFTDPETPDFGRDLNYMATPIEFFRRRTVRRNTLERVMDQLDRQRLTLQLGRFQFSIPRFGRTDPRPDTPNVAEINIDDLDFVRLNSNDTYTLNGRTIRLLGANFENYPVMPDGTVGPPSYTEAVRYKLYGPPPEYLSREGLNRRSVDQVDEEARSNIEMPPCYEDLASGGENCNSADNTNIVIDSCEINTAIRTSDDNAINSTAMLDNGNRANNNSESAMLNTSSAEIESSDNANGNNTACYVSNNTLSERVPVHNAFLDRVPIHNAFSDRVPVHNAMQSENNDNVETLSSIIDNLPAIDSDVNANEEITGTGVIDNINNDNIINNAVICNNNG